MSSPSPSPTMDVYYGDARDDLNASAANKERLALNHFDYFLKGHCVQIGIDIVEADSIPYRGIPRKSSNKLLFEFWDLMIGAFVTYRGNHARCECNPEKPRLKRGTAQQHCSSVRSFFNNKFRNEADIPVLQDKQWSKLMTKLRGKYRESNRASGKPAVEGIESSTREDREWLATGCLWDGTAETAEFLHLLNTSYHCSARGLEVSLIKPEDARSVEVNEHVYQYRILQVDVQRQKVITSRCPGVQFPIPILTSLSPRTAPFRMLRSIHTEIPSLRIFISACCTCSSWSAATISSCCRPSPRPR